METDITNIKRWELIPPLIFLNCLQVKVLFPIFAPDIQIFILNKYNMDLIDLSKRIYDEKGGFYQFKSPELETILDPDPYDKNGGYLIPSKDENHQTFIFLDNYNFKLKMYKRKRISRESEWEEWKFIAYID